MVIVTMWFSDAERQISDPDFKTPAVRTDPENQVSTMLRWLNGSSLAVLFSLTWRGIFLCVWSVPSVFVAVRCLIKDFEARPSVTHLLEHPFIKQAHGKDVALRQQLAALIQEQQEVGSKTKTKWDPGLFFYFSSC